MPRVAAKIVIWCSTWARLPAGDGKHTSVPIRKPSGSVTGVVRSAATRLARK